MMKRIEVEARPEVIDQIEVGATNQVHDETYIGLSVWPRLRLQIRSK